MSQNLYIESIAEAKQLREIAEANARNKIIDAITPQIKKLIENKLLSDDDNLESDMAGDDDEEAADMSMDSDAISMQGGEDLLSIPNPRTTDVADDKSASGAKINLGDDGQISLTLDDVEIVVNQKKNTFEAIEDRATSSRHSKTTARRAKIFEMKYKLFNIMLESEMKKGISAADREKFVQILETLQIQAEKIKSDIILTEGKSKNFNKFNSFIKEMTMSRKSMNNNVFDFLFENYGEGDVREVGAGPMESEKLAEADEADADMVSLDALKGPFKELAAALGMAVEEEEPSDDDEEEGEEEPSDDDEEVGEELGVKEEGRMFEIDESVLRRELRRMKRISEATSGVEDPEFTARAFGGGDVEDEMFIDVDEETLLNVLADELGRVKFKGGKMHETAHRSAPARRPSHDSRETSQLRARLGEYETMTESLKSQLVEMNLFNAKLLYANKLMQNKNLTQKQQRAIVEALDNAKTLREAKLLYKSLTASLNKREGGSLNENSTRTLGSASRSTPSAQVRPTSNGVEVDRWAVLAGIASKK
jgi:hypothetical protein